MKKVGIALVSALAVGILLSPAEALARGGGGHGHGGHFRNGGHGHPHGHPHFGHPHFGPHFHGGPRFHGRARFFGHPGWRYGWHGPRRVFAGGGFYPGYPVNGGLRFGGIPGGCSTQRNVAFLPNGWKKIVTVRTCFVR